MSLDYVRTLLEAAGEPFPTEVAPQNGMLSEREIAVLQRIAAGRSNQQIAQDFTVAVSTIKTHIHSIYTKLDVHSRTQAIARAKKAGLLS